MIDRRSLLGAGAALAGLHAGAAIAGRSGVAPRAIGARPLAPEIHDLAERTFRFFWDTGNPDNGMVPDRWPHPEFASIAAIGFALTAYPLGVELGWISRAQARARTLATLRFLDRAPMGDGEEGVSGSHGFFYHFLHMDSGLRFGRCELSSVDTGLLHLGVLFAGGWFDRPDADEAEIRRLATRIVDRAEWPWFQKPDGAISMGWHPASGFIARDWDGYNEGKLVYLLALGSGAHPVGAGAWERWCQPYPRFWRGAGTARHLAFAPLFGHQYTEMWVDLRGVRDAAMRAAGFDYFENGRRAAYADRAYCIRNPMRWTGYGPKLWGLTACDGPADVTLIVDGSHRTFRGYSARGPIDQPDGFDDGTLAPTAALGSLAAVPELAIPTLHALRRYAGGALYGRYGFVDSFNPSFRFPGQPLQRGRVDPTYGWIDSDWLGIDQGPILGAIANHAHEAVWRVMRSSAPIRRGLRRAGFTGGWLAA